MTEWIKLFATLLGSGGFSAIVIYLITRHDSKKNRIDELEKKFYDTLNETKKEEQKRFEEQQKIIDKLDKAVESWTDCTLDIQKNTTAVGKLVVGLGQDKLIYLADKYRARGGITLKEQAGLQSIYIPYHKELNGNGYGEMSYEYCMNELPVISEEEAAYCDKNKVKYNSDGKTKSK